VLELKSLLLYHDRMAKGPPLWLNLALRAERAVGSRVEQAVHSDAYFDVISELNRGKAIVTETMEGLSKRIWHLANLPAGTDVRRVREQLARVERRVIELSKELDEQRRALEPERE
jgi:hypothetical protein